MGYPSQDTSLTFGKLSEANARRCVESFPMCRDWTPADWMTALTGELGEAANILKKMRRGDMSLADMPLLAKELADVQTYLDLLANCLGIDLGEATRRKFNEVSARVDSAIRL